MSGSLPDEGMARDRFAEASAWFARMRGPDAAASQAEFSDWRRQPGNAGAYQEMEAIWAASAAVSRGADRPRRAVPLRLGLIAAGIAAAVTIGFLVRQTAERTETSALYGSERGRISSFALADGSRVTLDTGSRIRVDLGGSERRVALLAGRARFEVAKDADHPFVVQAGDDAVVARGTVFDVRLLPGGAEVALYEGAVDLERREPRAPPRVLARLRPGQKAVFAANDRAPAIAATRMPPWPAGVLAVEDVRLAEILAEANRYGATRIVLGDPALADLRLSGGFKPAETRNLAGAIAASLDLVVSTRPDGTIVLSRKPGRFSMIGSCAAAGPCAARRLAG